MGTTLYAAVDRACWTVCIDGGRRFASARWSTSTSVSGDCADRILRCYWTAERRVSQGQGRQMLFSVSQKSSGRPGQRGKL